MPGLVVRRVPTLRHPSALRLISFAVAARAAAARHGYDLVQSHERALGQDLYRAGEGCHAGYLEAMGRRHNLEGASAALDHLEDGLLRLNIFLAKTPWRA